MVLNLATNTDNVSMCLILYVNAQGWLIYFGRSWKEENYANVPHLSDSLYNPCIQNKTYHGPRWGHKITLELKTQVQVTVMSIYNCIQKIIMYKLAANVCSPVLPHWLKACATSLLLLLTVAKESVSQSTRTIPYCNMESSFKCLVKPHIQIKCVKHRFSHPVFLFLYRHTFPKHLQCCV